MRFHTTTEFQNAKRAWRDAYSAHDVFAEAGDDTSSESKAASETEYVALKALLLMPAATPTEIAEKLRIIAEREIDSSWTEWHPLIMAQIDRDLREQQRPAVSPVMKAAFEEWREAQRAHCCDTIGEDEHDFALCNAAADAACQLLRLPCYTPGDFLVKVYVDQLGEHGGTFYGHDNRPEGVAEGFPFEIDDSALREGLGGVDGEAREAFLRDLDDTDLGACLLALGRVEFDAKAWLAAADRAGVAVYLAEQPDGSSGLSCGMGPDDANFRGDRVNRVQRLLTGNGGSFGDERVAAVADHIRAHEPHRIVRSMEQAA